MTPLTGLIKKAVCEEYGITLEELASRRRSRYLSWPRQEAMWLTLKMTSMSFPEVGRHYDRDHTTVMHAKEQVEKRLEGNIELSMRMDRITKRIEQMVAAQQPSRATAEHFGL